MNQLVADTSVHDAAPTECFKLIGELATYRYTSDNVPVTCDGEVYQPLSGITRTALDTSSLLDSLATIDIRVPVTCDLAIAYSFLQMPLILDVEIRAVDKSFPDEFELVWQGQSVDFPVNDNYATISTQSIIQAALNRQLNQVYFQTSCNHLVYDEHCTMDPDDFTVVATIVDIKGHVLTVDDTGFPDSELIVGKCLNVRTGESRIIVENIGTILTVGYAFIDIVVGDTVKLIKGCDNSYTTCETVFNNLLNFSGFKFMPSSNPYTDPV